MRSYFELRHQTPILLCVGSLEWKEEIKRRYEKKKCALCEETGIELPNINIEIIDSLNGYLEFVINEKKVFTDIISQSGIDDFVDLMVLHIYKLISNEHLYDIVKEIEERYQHIKEEIEKENLKYSVIYRVFKQLIIEGLHIDKLKEALESLIFHYEASKNIDELTFAVRSDLKENLIRPFLNKEGFLEVVELEKVCEEKIKYYEVNSEYFLCMNSIEEEELIKQVKQVLKASKLLRSSPVLMVNKMWTRAMLSRLFQRNHVNIPVFTKHELFHKNNEYKGKKFYGQISFSLKTKKMEVLDGNITVNKQEEREKKINEALEKRDKEMFYKLTSREWEKFL